jgi:hypothetical protein
MTARISTCDLRASFPALSDVAKYPDELCDMYLELAHVALDEKRWGQFYEIGQKLWAAHYITLDAQDERRGAGSIGGVVSSKSLGGVSISYDASSTLAKDAGDFNLTSYGRRYWRFLRMAGMGGIQSGGQHREAGHVG